MVVEPFTNWLLRRRNVEHIAVVGKVVFNGVFCFRESRTGAGAIRLNHRNLSFGDSQIHFLLIGAWQVVRTNRVHVPHCRLDTVLDLALDAGQVFCLILETQLAQSLAGVLQLATQADDGVTEVHDVLAHATFHSAFAVFTSRSRFLLTLIIGKLTLAVNGLA